MISAMPNEPNTFAQAEQAAQQCLAQARMALAFLGDDERAHRVTRQLDRMSASLAAMQAQHAALETEHTALRERFEDDRDRFSGGFVTESLEGQPPSHSWTQGWNQIFCLHRDRLSALALLLVTTCVLIAMAAGAARAYSTAHWTGTPSGARSVSPAPGSMGDTLSAGGVSCTLVSVALPPWEEARAQNASLNATGPRDVIVRVRLRNIGSRDVSSDLASFRLRLGAGSAANEEPPMNAAAPSLELAPGHGNEADLVFVIQRGDHPAELVWQPLVRDEANERAWLLGI